MMRPLHRRRPHFHDGARSHPVRSAPAWAGVAGIAFGVALGVVLCLLFLIAVGEL